MELVVIMGFCQSREHQEVRPVHEIERGFSDTAGQFSAVKNNLLELKKARKAPILSLAESPLYRRRRVESSSTGSLPTPRSPRSN